MNKVIIILFYEQRYQSLLDAWTPFVVGRWVFTLVILLIFMGRVFYYQVCQNGFNLSNILNNIIIIIIIIVIVII